MLTPDDYERAKRQHDESFADFAGIDLDYYDHLIVREYSEWKKSIVKATMYQDLQNAEKIAVHISLRLMGLDGGEYGG